jgi:acyl carrier protein
MPANYRSAVRTYIECNFILGSGVSLGDTDSLLDLQLIDSTGFLELVGFLEERFGIKVADDEMLPDNLESLANIERFLQRKLG